MTFNSTYTQSSPDLYPGVSTNTVNITVYGNSTPVLAVASSSYNYGQSPSLTATLPAISSTYPSGTVTQQLRRGYPGARFRSRHPHHHGRLRRLRRGAYGRQLQGTHPHHHRIVTPSTTTGLTISGGVATRTTSALPVGNNSITVSFPGNASYNAATSAAATIAISQIASALLASARLRPRRRMAATSLSRSTSPRVLRETLPS